MSDLDFDNIKQHLIEQGFNLPDDARLCVLIKEAINRAYRIALSKLKKEAEDGFKESADRAAERVRQDLAAAGAPHDLINYQVALFRQMADATTAQAIENFRRDKFKVVQ